MLHGLERMMNYMKNKDKTSLEKHANSIRREILKMAYETKSSHTGGCLSCVDLLTILYFKALRVNPQDPLNPNRDRFIFSKAHASKALYAVLVEKGFFPKEKLSTYERNNGLPGHTARNVVPGVEMSGGSLGHGLSIAAGMAYAGKLNKSVVRVFAMLSDGECDEGSTWEAILFAGHHKLSNLIAVVDYNKIQSFGRTKDILDLEPFRKKWEAFGWGVIEVDGHNMKEIEKVFRKIPFTAGKPSALIAHTIKGYKGVKKHINQVSSHYKPPTKEEYEELLKELL